MLYRYAQEENIFDVSPEKIRIFVEFANKAGAITCMNYGAIPSLPTLGDIIKD